MNHDFQNQRPTPDLIQDFISGKADSDFTAYGSNDMSPYSDIINLEHPTSKKHPRMHMMQRAAQFAPFAALSGYDDAIEETAIISQHSFE